MLFMLVVVALFIRVLIGPVVKREDLLAFDACIFFSLSGALCAAEFYVLGGINLILGISCFLRYSKKSHEQKL